MAIAFSVLSLKRNRSNSKESVSKKFSKLKSGFSIFSSNRKKNDIPDNTNQRRPFLFQYFRGQEEPKNYYANDRHYEYNRYHHLKEERNMHTLPTHVAPKLTSILIKRSGTTPSCIQHMPIRKRTCSNATISNMTINSEDLTAKEFADIAGIRILPEEEQEDLAGDIEQVVPPAAVASRKLTVEKEDEIMESSMRSISDTMKESPSFKIWDNAFWCLPEVDISRPIPELDRKTSITSNNAKNLNEPPILHELRRMGTHKSEKDANSCVIKKGRFEIQLALLDTPSIAVVDNTTITLNNDTLSFSDPGVVEWKRKGKKPTTSLT